MTRFLVIAAIALFALYSKAQESPASVYLGEDVLVRNSKVYNYGEESICSKTANLAKEAKFKKPQGNFQADFIAVDKKRRLVHLMQDGKIFRSYNSALGREPVGKKMYEGDNKTPEGLYFIDYKNSASEFHLSLHISYPNQDDINRARKAGKDPGGDIMIHGLPDSAFKRMFINHPKKNWTRGCVAVNDGEIEEIWGYVKTNTPVELCP